MPTELEQRFVPYLKLRFFRDLVHEQRVAIFRAFGFSDAILAEARSHIDERRLFDHIAAALQAQQPDPIRELRAYKRGLEDAQQPGAQAVAWHTDDHLTDKSATTYDPVIADRWRAKGWPVTPHYTHPQPPSIPEPSEEDVEAAFKARWPLHWNVMSSAKRALEIDVVRNIITTDRARLRERIGGGS